MDFFAKMGAVPAIDEAEVKVDLSGMEKDAALQKLDTIVKFCKKSSAATLYVGFDPARPGAGETLFQPVARYFKFEKHNGYVDSATPVMADGKAGIFVRFRI
jgi:hypothetical protein